MPENITEEMRIHKDWYKEAREMTLDKLPEFLNKLTEKYNHDYGTICHAIASSAIAAAWAVEHSPQGGITEFQAGAIMWEFITNWMTEYKDKPVRILKIENMLYPQYKNHFNSISPETWKWLQDEAKKKLSEDFGVDEVREHWKNITNGQVPFGYSIENG